MKVEPSIPVVVRKVQLRTEVPVSEERRFFFTRSDSEAFLHCLVQESSKIENYNFEFQVFLGEKSFAIYGGDVVEIESSGPFKTKKLTLK